MPFKKLLKPQESPSKREKMHFEFPTICWRIRTRIEVKFVDQEIFSRMCIHVCFKLNS